MLVYVATGWVNPYTVGIKEITRRLGYGYYHFTESDLPLDYNSIEPGLRDRAAKIQVDALKHASILQAYNINYSTLHRADVFILAEPASKGSYTEYGMATILRIPTILCVTPSYELGVMDAGFTHVALNMGELENILSGIKEKGPDPKI